MGRSIKIKMRYMKIILKIADIVGKIIEIATVIILVSLTVLVFSQVIMRNFFNSGFVWSEEMSRLLLLSVVLIAAPLVFFKDGHVRFDMVVLKARPLLKKIEGFASIIVVAFFYSVYTVSHLELMETAGGVVSPSLSIPNNIFFAAGLIGAVLGLFFCIIKIIIKIRDLKE